MHWEFHKPMRRSRGSTAHAAATRSRFRYAVLTLALAICLPARFSFATHVAASGSAYASAVLADTPSVYYRLGEASGTSAADSSGHSVTGTYTSSVTYGVAGAIIGDSDTAVGTSGTAVTAPDATLPQGSAARTLEAWVKTTGTGYQGIIGYGSWTSTPTLLDWELAGPRFVIQLGSANYSINLPYGISDNAWHFVAITYDGSSVVGAFVDGQLIGGVAVGALATGGGQLVVGSGIDGGFTGSIDEAAVYPSALSPAQIGAHWRVGVAGICPTVPSTAYGGVVVGDHPLRYYRLGETSGQSAGDSSGNCRNASYRPGVGHGAGALTGDANGSSSTPSSGGSLALGSADGLPANNAARTIEAWIKTPGGPYEGIISYGANTGGDALFQVELINSSQFYIQTGASNRAINAPESLADNQWHHIAVTYDGAGTVTGYVDGQLVGTTTVPSLVTNTLGPLAVGGSIDGSFVGSLDEAAVYASALTSAQINAHWKSGSASVCPPVPNTGYAGTVLADSPTVYYRFAETSGRAAADSSGHCRAGAYVPTATRVGGVVATSPGAAVSAPSPGLRLFASADSLPLGASARTVEAWTRTPGYSGNDPFQNIVGYGTGTGSPTLFEVELSGALAIYVQIGTANHVFALPYAVLDDRWHYVAVTYDGTSVVTAYLDGQSVGSAAMGTLATAGTGPLELGTGIDGPFNGAIDEVAAYSSALSAARIQAHYTAAQLTGGAPTAASERGGGSLCYKCLQRELHHAVRVQPIDTENGNMYHTFSDFDIPGRGVNLLMTRTYNSNAAATDAGLGFGWVDNYGAKLVATGPMSVSGSTVTITEENGAQTVFTSNGSAWTAPPRVIATLSGDQGAPWTLIRDLTQTLAFNAAGQLVSEKDRNGYTTSLAYVGGQLATVTDEAGRTLTFGYSGTHRTSVTDFTGRQVRYQYNDGLGNLTDVFDVNNGHWVFGYDSAHHLLTMQDPATNVVTTHYDSQGRADWQKDGKLQQTSFAYSGDQTTVTDPMQNVTVEYYAQGLRVAETRGAGTAQAATWRYAYDPDTLALTAVVDPNGNATTYTYDSQANLLSRTDALGRVTQYQQYNGFNEPQVIVDGNNVATQLGYDANGNLHTVSTPLVGSSPLQTQTTVYNHADPNHLGDVTSMVDPDGKTWVYGYDQYGDRTSVTDPLGDQASMSYTSLSWLLTETTPRGNVQGCGCAAQFTTTYSYQYPGGGTDEYGDPQTITGPPGPNHVARVTSLTYDADRNLHTQTDADGHPPTTYLYDPNNQLVEVDRADGSKVSTVYNADGTVHQQIDYQQIGGSPNATTYGYDALARVTSVADPLQRTTTYAYDGAGNLVSKLDPQGQTTSSTYDAANQLTGITYSDGTTPNVTSVAYDGDGQRLGMSDGTGASSWTWDSLHHMTKSTDGSGATVLYGYDLKGQLTTITYPGGHQVQRHFDDAGRMDWLQDWLGNPKTLFTPDQDSNITKVQYPNQTTAVMVPDETDHITSITDTAGSTQLARFTYGRDPLSQETSVSASGLPDTHTYGYTALNHVGQVDGAGTYGYDAADNPTTFPDNTVQTFDAAHQLQTTGRIALVGTGKAEGGPTSSGNLPVPFTTQGQVLAGDTILLAITVPSIDASSVQTPAGYSVVASKQTVSGLQQPETIVFSKPATGGETSVSINTGSVPYQKTAVAAIYRGVDSIEAKIGQQAQSTNSVAVGTVTTSVPGDRLVLVEGAAGNTSAQNWSSSPTVQSTTMTDRVHESDMALSATALADGVASAAGTYGPGTASFGTASTSANLVDILLALKPATTAYGFDARGNRTSVRLPSGALTTLTYDQANRLTGYGSAETYAYNGDGLRMSKTPVNGAAEQFTYDVAEGLPLLLQDGATQFVYGPGGEPLEQVTPQPPITPVGSASGFTAATSASASVHLQLPAQIHPNDLIVLGVTFPQGAGTTVKTPPAGYAQVKSVTSSGTSPGVLVVYTRKADGTESGQTVTATLSAPSAAAMVAAVYRGVDPATAIDTSTIGDTNNGTTVSPASALTHYSGDEWAVLQGAYYVGTSLQSWSAPAGMTEEPSQGETATVAAGIADQTAATPSTVGPLTSQFSGKGQLTAVFLALKTPPQITYFHQDQLGSTRLLTDQAGTVVGSFTFDPYGNLTASGGTTTTPLLYAGQYRDAEPGFYYMRARFYDPVTAQFLTRDPAVATTRQPYSYALDNPLNASDPSGLCGWTDPFGCMSDVAGHVAGGVSAAAHAVGSQAVSWSGDINHFINDNTFGFCANASAGLIGGGVASGCIAFNAHSFGATGTLGGGLEFPGGASLSAGPFIGLGAHNPQDLGGPFTYAGANGGEGLLFGADFAGGTGTCGQPVTTFEPSVGVGLNLPWPASVHAGASNTWVWTR